jgi:hypothetical protein
MDINRYLEKMAHMVQDRLKALFHRDVEFEWCYRGTVLGTCLLAALLVCVAWSAFKKDVALEGNSITRPEGTSRSMTLTVGLEGDGEHEVEIDVAPRQYRQDEITDNFSELVQALPDMIKGDNPSLGQVSRPLDLVTYVQDHDIAIQWFSGNYERLRQDGSINADGLGDEGEWVRLTAWLSCQDVKEEAVLDVHIVAGEVSADGDGGDGISRVLQSSMEEQAYEPQVTLPSQIDGKNASYSIKSDNATASFMLLGILAAAGIIAGREAGRKSREKLRLRQLLRDYPELVSKLTLLTGAGMTVRRAWEKIAGDYLARKKQDGAIRPAYEEMVITNNQMASGVPEGLAYVEYGRRCGPREYRKLGTLLEQNMRKGAKGLARLLEQESAESFEQRKNYARQLGEEAGTKLLLPMIMMLLIVMVIIMLPAILSFQI